MSRGVTCHPAEVTLQCRTGLARLTAVCEDPGSNRAADGRVYRDMQRWARAAYRVASYHETALPRCFTISEHNSE